MANLIQGNFAEAGSGGGIRLQDVNGAEGPNLLYKVTVINNMIVNNVAGMAGGGISLANSPGAVIENNTIANNDSVGIAGPLFVAQPTTATPNPAGISTEPTGAELAAILKRNGKVTFPNGPQVLNNNIVWHNRSFFFDGTKTDPATKLPALCSSNKAADATGTTHICSVLQAPTETYGCPLTSLGLAPSYWDLGVFGDTSTTPGSNAGGIKLVPTNSILSDVTNYPRNIGIDPLLAISYCNGPRAMPGQIYEPGQPFLPPFTLAASMTLDEAGNFVDLRYGPLSTSYLANAADTHATPYGDYRITPKSRAVDAGSNVAPPRDFFDTPRPQGRAVDIGAHELLPVPSALSSISPAGGVRGTAVPVTIAGTNLTGATALTGLQGITAGASTVDPTGTQVTTTLAIPSGAPLGVRTIGVTGSFGTAAGTVSFTVTGANVTSISPPSGVRGTTVPVTLTGTNLTRASAIAVSGGGVTCTGITSTSTTVRASCAITAGAAFGARSVTVTTPIGTTNTVAFTVSPPTATLTSVTPSASTATQRGTTVPVTLTGTNFTTGSTVAVSGAGITVSRVTVVSSTRITANFAISTGAANTGAHNVTVTNASGRASTSVKFTKN